MDEDFIDNSKYLIRDFYVPNRGKIELLQSILESESGERVSYEDAQEVGLQLITLYESLAGSKTIFTEDSNDA